MHRSSSPSRIARLAIELLAVWMAANVNFASADELRVSRVGLRLNRQRDVAAHESGPIADLLVREGDRVKAGTILAKLDDEDALIELQRAEIARDHALDLANSNIAQRSSEQSMLLASLDWDRVRTQSERFPDTVSAAELDRLRIELERAKLAVEKAKEQGLAARQALRAAENDVQAAQRGVARRQIVAPIDGIVVEVDFQTGEWVKAGEKVLRLVDVAQLRAEGFIAASEQSSRLVGRSVTFVADRRADSNPTISTTQSEEGGKDDKLRLSTDSARKFSGKVVFVSPEANPVTQQLRIWAVIENPDGHLQPGLSGQLILADQADNDIVKLRSSQPPR